MQFIAIGEKRSGGPVQAFVDRGVDFVSGNSLRELVTAMNKLPDVDPLDYATVAAAVTARDREVANRFSRTVRSPQSALPVTIRRPIFAWWRRTG